MNIGGRVTKLERERDRKLAEYLKQAISEAVERAAAEFHLPRERVWDASQRAVGVLQAAEPRNGFGDLSVLTVEELGQLEVLIRKCEQGG